MCRYKFKALNLGIVLDAFQVAESGVITCAHIFAILWSSSKQNITTATQM